MLRSSMTNVGLILLAAGASQRLGTPKQLLRDAEGLSLIRHAALTALESTCRPIVAVLGAYADEIAEEIHDLRVTAAVNLDWEGGMASSLKTGVAALTREASPEAVIVMLCDQPGVTASLLDQLIAVHRTSASGLVACEYGGILGVPALFEQRMFSSFEALKGDQGARFVIRSHDTPIARVDFPLGALDIDTPQDWERWRHLGSMRS